MYRLSCRNEPQNESANVHALKKVFTEGNIVNQQKSRKIVFLDVFFDFHVIWPCRPCKSHFPCRKVANFQKFEKFTIFAKKCGENRYIWSINVEMSFESIFEILAIFSFFLHFDLPGNH